MHTPPSSPPEIVRCLLQVISRQLPMSAAAALLDNDLTAYMDGKKCGGVKQWGRWVRFLHYNADKKMSGLAIVIDHLSEADNRVMVTAHWQATLAGKLTVAKPGTVTYQVRDGKIINIWTRRKNYVFIYGNGIAARPLAFYWLCLRMALWRDPADA